MTSDQLRQRFLNFFKKRKHVIVPSDSLIPRHDPTLLFTGAGMNQFKDQFMGRNVTYKSAATCQKCLRTADLERVGKTPGHHTFFEMLGNFSFGGYFKKEAIIWAWEFLSKELRIPEERLWVSVYQDDDKSYNIWKDDISVPQARIIRLGDKENFWPSEVKKNGPNGPCGPCSEVFYDWGVDTGCLRKECSPSCDCGRFVEVWNLVFTQFDRKEGGVLEPLPTKNIDTGMGLERLAAVIQHKKTNFEIDIFAYIIKAITRTLNMRYGKDKDTDSHINAISDHIRAITFAISDGVRPSNEGRGFVIRKLIRRTSQRARSIGLHEPFIYKIVPAVAKAMKAAYPELTGRREDIAEVVLREEINLKDILDTIIPHVEEELITLKNKKESIVAGDIIFRYYDEKGIPLDLMEEKAREYNLTLDIGGFNNLLEGQRVRSRDKSRVAGSIFFEKLSDVDLRTKFLYNQNASKGRVLGILKEFEGKTERVDKAGAKDIVHIALDTTPFYGEAGGQAGDRGVIIGEDLKIQIYDAKRYEDTIDHIGKIEEGTLSVGDEVELNIDTKRRERIMRNHTATHLLHSALRKVLGDHVQQYGSLVEEEYFRFDFTHPSKLEEKDIERIEELVNGYIEKDITVDTAIMDLQEAKSSGAIALFGEKYKEKVMVRTIGDVSKELCGGTHVYKTGEIGVFKILNEGSIASGVRRIEVLTGEAVYNWLKADIQKIIAEYNNSMKEIKNSGVGAKDTIKRLEDYLRPILFKSETIAKKEKNELGRYDVNIWIKELRPAFTRTTDDLAREFKKVKKESRNIKLNELKKGCDEFIKNAKTIGDIRVISREIKDADMEILRVLVDSLKDKAGSAIVILGSKDSTKASLVCGVTGDLIKKGLDATSLIKEIAAIIGGSGGGRADLAQAGGRSPERLKEALEKGFKIIEDEASKI